MDDISVDSTDTQYDDSGSTDDAGYASSGDADSVSETSSDYYGDDDCADYDSSGSYDGSGSSDGSDGSGSGSGSDDDSLSAYDDTSDETTGSETSPVDTPSYDEPVSAETTPTEGIAASDPAAGTDDAGTTMDCPPAFPLSAGPSEMAATPTAVDPVSAVAADSGASTAASVPAVATAPAMDSHVTYPAGTIEPSTTMVNMGGNDDGYIPAQAPAPQDLGIPRGIMPSEVEQQFVATGWTHQLVPDGHGGQVEALRPPKQMDANTFRGQLTYLQSHLQSMIAQQQGLPAPATTVEGGLPPGTLPAGTTHVRLDYVPEQVARTDTSPPAGYYPNLSPADQQTLLQSQLRSVNTMGDNWLRAAGATVVYVR